MKSIARKAKNIKVKKEVRELGEIEDLNTKVALIQALIPIGLEYVSELLQQEVTQLAGSRYARRGNRETGTIAGVNRAGRFI